MIARFKRNVDNHWGWSCGWKTGACISSYTFSSAAWELQHPEKIHTTSQRLTKEIEADNLKLRGWAVHRIIGVKLFIGSMCILWFEICTPEGRGGEKYRVQISKQSHRTFDKRNTFFVPSTSNSFNPQWPSHYRRASKGSWEWWLRSRTALLTSRLGTAVTVAQGERDFQKTNTMRYNIILWYIML